jgi:hypothetical protein
MDEDFGFGSTLTPMIPTISYGLYAQTNLSTPVVNTTVETTIVGSGIGTLTVPANAFKIGDSFVAKMCGNEGMQRVAGASHE